MRLPRFNLLFLAALLLAASPPIHSESSIDPDRRYAWMPNAGWLDFRPDAANGVYFGERFASGYIYAANIGWIHLGDGTPAYLIAYTNASAQDYGVNLEDSSNGMLRYMSGYAWSPNTGWINFSVDAQTGEANRPRIDLATGELHGYAWSGNLGWLRLDPENGGVVTTFKNAAQEWTLYE